MEKVILLGTGFSAIPFFSILSEDYEVFPLGGVKSDPLNFEKNYVNANYRNLDEVLYWTERIKPNYVVPSCNDSAYETGALLASRFSYPGYSEMKECNILLNKWLFRNMLADESYNPSFQGLVLLDKEQIDFGPRVIAKPFRGHSGIGVRIFDLNKDSVIQELRNLEKTHFIENYVEGSLHSHSAFFHDCKIVADFFVDEFCGKVEFAVSESNHPSCLSMQTQIAIREITIEIARKLKIQSGLLHSQFLFDGRKVWIIESMRRCPGDFFGTLVEKSSGYEYYRNYMAPFLGKEVEPFKQTKPFETIVRQSIISSVSGKLGTVKLRFSDDLIEEVEFFPFSSMNKHVPIGLSGKVGIAFLSVKSEKLSTELSKQAISEVTTVIGSSRDVE